jgi:hypothetical protein
MAFTIVRENGFVKVILYCDECNEQISEVTMAHVLYADRRALGQDDAVSDFAFLHKRACTEAYEMKHGEKLTMELRDFLVYALYATNTDVDEAIRSTVLTQL